MKHRLINATRSLTLRAPALTACYVCPLPARPAGADSPKEAAPPMPALSGEAAVRHLRQTGLRDSLSAAVAAALYKAEARKGGGYEASNPKQNFRIVFTNEGVEVCGSSPAGLGWRLGMRLAAYGYGERKMPVTATDLKAEGDRVEYELRSGDGAGLSEWYVNRADGLEQGFTIPQAPGERRDGEELSLWLSLSGSLKARAAEEGRAILLDGRGTGLRYDSLHAYDATGRELPARMMLSGGVLKLEVSDEGAVYPVTIDPTLRVRLSVGRLNLEVWDEEEANPATIAPTTPRREPRLTAGDRAAGDSFGRSAQETKLTASDSKAYDRFGASVAISGDTAVVGAYYGGNPSQGAAYVFTRSGETWTERQKLTASDGVAGDEFGISIAIDGDTAVVGAQGADVGSNANQGAAYVFTRSGETWTEQAKLTASDGARADSFGNSVAIDGDTAVVGAYYGNTNQGAAYVFTQSGETWTERQKLTASDGAASDYFGASVAIDGDTAVVGTFRAKAAYVFTRNGETWTERQKLTPSGGTVTYYFGKSVAIDGDTVVIGAYGALIGGNPNQGAAYVFTRSGEAWTERQILTASDGGVDDYFGWSVAISGGRVVVGAIGDDDRRSLYQLFQGSAYLFALDDTTWTERQKLTASDGAVQDRFGASVAISGDTAVVGAPEADVGGNSNQGAAYVFESESITINPPNPELPVGIIGQAYNFTFTASGGTAPFIFAVTMGVLPPGLTLDSGGTLLGVPIFQGTFTFTVQATDVDGVSGRRDYTLVIKGPVIVNPTDPNLPEGAVGLPYNLTFTASGGTAPFTFAVSAGSLPAGLTLAEDGTLSGPPVLPRTSNFTVQATDNNGATGQRAYTLIVKESRTT